MPSSLWEKPEFDPEASLKTIKPLPAEEKHQRIEDYRDKLFRQMDGIVLAQDSIRRKIETNPNIHYAELVELWEEETEELGLAPWQHEEAMQVFDKYTDRRNAIKEIREIYPEDDKLFEHIFGEPPKGRIEVETGPITIFFTCENLEDYTSIYFYKNPHAPANGQEIANMSGGVSISAAPIEWLEGAIIAQNGFKDPKTSQIIKTHEEQHAYRRLFKPAELTMQIPKSIETAENSSERLARLETICRYKRQLQEHRMSDEVLAYLKDGSSKYEIINLLAGNHKSIGLYNYFIETTERIRKLYPYPETEQAIKTVFEDEYYVMVSNAIDAVDAVRETGLSLRQAIDYFTMLPVSHWKKWAARVNAYFDSEKFISPRPQKMDYFDNKYDELASEFDTLPYSRPKKSNKKAR